MATPTNPCQYFLEHYFHFQYRSDQREIIVVLENHLSFCAPCTRFYTNELLLTDMLTKRMKDVKWEEAPSQLLIKLETLRDRN